MFKHTQLWTSVSTITLVGAISVGITGCESGDTSKAESALQHSSAKQYAENEGEGSTETPDLGSNDLAYLTQLGLMRGHIYVGNELYKAGEIEHAKTHMKHPESELYADIAPAFEARESAGFAAELSALTAAVENELGTEEVAAAYTALSAAISANESVVAQSSMLPSQRLKLVVELLRIAGEEYAIAVVDGEMENAHEYQDALGFTTIATAITNEIDGDDQVIIEAKEATIVVLNGLKSLWPTLVPPDTLSTEAVSFIRRCSKY